MQIIKNLLFNQTKSSLNLFLVAPIVIVFLLGCFCSSNDSPTVSCITADGKTLTLTTRNNKLQMFNLSDGKEIANNSPNSASVFCTQENDVVTIKVEKNEKERNQRSASWKNSAKTKQLGQIDFLELYIGLIQDKYIVSSSREFIQESKTSRPGGSRIYYKVFTKPQIFTLEDLSTGKLTNYPMTPEKLGIETRFKETYFRFYPLHLSADGNLLFAVDTQFDSPRLYKLEMLSGKLSKISENKITVNDIPPKNVEYTSDRDFNAVADKAGKFVAFTYSMDNGKNGLKKLIRVFNLETNQEIISKTVDGVSFSGNGVQLIFEENSKKLAMQIFGFKFDPTRSVSDVTVFDLQNGNEIATVDAKVFFKDPETVGLLNLIGDELIVNYSHNSQIWGKKTNICKLNIVSKQIVWEAELK